MSACSAEFARAEDASARQQADQQAQHTASQHVEEMQKIHAALAALKKSLDLKEQACQAAAIDSQEADARANSAERARLSAVSTAEQHFLYAKQANDRANSFEQQAKHAQLAAQQAQHDAQQKASRVGELERLVEQLMQQVMQVLASNQVLASHLGIIPDLHTAFLDLFRLPLHGRYPCRPESSHPWC